MDRYYTPHTHKCVAHSIGPHQSYHAHLTRASRSPWAIGVWVCMYNCGIIPVVLYQCFIQHSQRSIALYSTPKVEQRPNAFIVTHELGWASTRLRPGPPLCSIRNNSIVKSPQRGIQSSASGCSSSALIVDMKLNLKRTSSTRMRMVVVVALMNLIAYQSYP